MSNEGVKENRPELLIERKLNKIDFFKVSLVKC